MHFYSLLLAGSLLSSAFAAPTWPPKHKGKGKNPGVSLAQLQTQQPLDGLPSNSNVTLKYIGLGVGVQNYTCASTTSTPKSIGALATIFDLTAYLEKTDDLTTDISNKYLEAYQDIACTEDASDISNNACEERINSLHLPLLGKQFFADINGAGVPSFQLYNGEFLSSQKVGDVSAPAGSYAGANGAGAVDWLFLVQDGTGLSVGLTEAYRINTAGGDALSTGCSAGAAEISVKYAAEYWLYD